MIYNRKGDQPTCVVLPSHLAVAPIVLDTGEEEDPELNSAVTVSIEHL